MIANGLRLEGERSSFFAGFSLLMLFIVSLFLESQMTSVFLLQRIPRRFIEGNDLDRLRFEDLFGYQKSKLALVSVRVPNLSCILKLWFN